MRWVLLPLFSAALLSVVGCKKEVTEQVTQTIYIDTAGLPPNSIQDLDGHVYSTVHIGTQRWMAENLRSVHYGNGDPIAYLSQDAPWSIATGGAWSNYATDASYDALYGKLYNWYAVIDPRNVCPAGWHVPTDADWMELEEAVGVPFAELDDVGGRGFAANAGGKLKSTALWDAPNTGANDSSEFSGYPGGCRTAAGGFTGLGSKGFWWSATEQDIIVSWSRQLYWNSGTVYRQTLGKRQGGSIRCVQD